MLNEEVQQIIAFKRLGGWRLAAGSWRVAERLRPERGRRPGCWLLAVGCWLLVVGIGP